MKFIQIFLLFFSIIGTTILADQLKTDEQILQEIGEQLKDMQEKVKEGKEFLEKIRSWRAFSDKFFVVYATTTVCFLIWAVYNKKKNEAKIKQENAQKIG